MRIDKADRGSLLVKEGARAGKIGVGIDDGSNDAADKDQDRKPETARESRNPSITARPPLVSKHHIKHWPQQRGRENAKIRTRRKFCNKSEGAIRNSRDGDYH